eukprot:gene22008-biopygen1876
MEKVWVEGPKEEGIEKWVEGIEKWVEGIEKWVGFAPTHFSMHSSPAFSTFMRTCDPFDFVPLGLEKWVGGIEKWVGFAPNHISMHSSQALSR